MKINFDKYADGLVPAIIQDAETQQVLMLGFMNPDAWQKTQQTGTVTFYSRSKERLWTKGEESGNFLELISAEVDCDQDSLLLKVRPHGPVCHQGTDTCWGEVNESHYGFLSQLEDVIAMRLEEGDTENSYVARLFSKGINKVAQKVGEEAVELVIEAKDDDQEAFLNEGADLMFHYLLLLQTKGYRLEDIVQTLRSRH
ncbi:bifunctional phosphoribosyl-AMP cyclohydrolase/phosphoribosyl-ATP diphosphatase HisIE [Aureitalea marina]|uniref:Histidine biosynthesis bifunctional protein HisIE n=1 Tax=Aureitalea marina TaxID=930804 RepID=A0A2S7KPD9_9FLAO|nr:bifunctional phosphoribosyl-AMP cyclohydrolase/phosphoribosyl-ATP diphosphatase HisIE [Aureitalea marina]PQB04433.1 bifunctional phosphoribosyl-AMP cyclohydrolase/phosphoribosyl-ATP diphosphatase [Aureitalea marina]